MKRYIKSYTYTTFNAFRDFATSYDENSDVQSRRCLAVCKNILRYKLDVSNQEIENAVNANGDNYQTLCAILKDKAGYDDFSDYLSDEVYFEAL